MDNNEFYDMEDPFSMGFDDDENKDGKFEMFCDVVAPLIINYQYNGEAVHQDVVRGHAMNIYHALENNQDISTFPLIQKMGFDNFMSFVFSGLNIPEQAEEEVLPPPAKKRTILSAPEEMEDAVPLPQVEVGRKKNPQFNFSNILLTWSTCRVPKEDCASLVYRFFMNVLKSEGLVNEMPGTKSRKVPSFVMVCQEHHISGELHLHAFVHIKEGTRVYLNTLRQGLSLKNIKGDDVVSTSLGNDKKPGRGGGGVKGGIEYILKKGKADEKDWSEIICWPETDTVKKIYEALCKGQSVDRQEFMEVVRKVNEDGSLADLDQIVRSGKFDDLLSRNRYTLDYARKVQGMLMDEPFPIELFYQWYNLWGEGEKDSAFHKLNDGEKEVMNWIKFNLHPLYKTNKHKQKQLWIVSQPNARKSSLIRLMAYFFRYHVEESSIKDYFMPLYADRQLAYFDDIHAPFNKPIGPCLKLWEGGTVVLNNKGSMSSVNGRIPWICASQPHPTKTEGDLKPLFEDIHQQHAIKARFIVVELNRPLLFAPRFAMSRKEVYDIMEEEIKKKEDVILNKFDYGELTFSWVNSGVREVRENDIPHSSITRKK